jgi:uncharacterized protein (UPF0276 family)
MRKKSNHSDSVSQCPPDANPAGIGLRHAHYQAVTETKPDIGWIEVHPENYFGGGIHRHYLSKAREIYPVSFHAVGLSLGSAACVSREHLQSIRDLISIYEPFQISDHASWSMSGNAHLNDLLPLPYTEETLSVLCRNVDEAQEFLGRRMLVENPSTYLAFRESTMSEWEFLNETARRTGCGILLDVNNIYVQSHNHGFDQYKYLAGIEKKYVGEIHLAGHMERDSKAGGTVLIDTHDSLVRPEVWDLYSYAVSRFGAVPTLIEWDQKLPELGVLVAESHRARDIILRSELRHAAE